MPSFASFVLGSVSVIAALSCLFENETRAYFHRPRQFGDQAWKPDIYEAQRRLWRFFCARCVTPSFAVGVQGSLVLAGDLVYQFSTLHVRHLAATARWPTHCGGH